MSGEWKHAIAILRDRPQRKQDVLKRMIAVFASYEGKVPTALLDSIHAVHELDEDTEIRCDQLEAILDEWARLH